MTPQSANEDTTATIERESHSGSGASAHRTPAPRQPEPAQPQHHTSNLLVLALLVFAGFVCIFNEAEMNIALPMISREFGIEVTTAQWLTTGYMLVTGTFMPLAAFVMNRFGSRRAVLGALSLLLFGIVVSALAPSFAVLLTGRLLQALGCSFFIPVMMTIVISVAPKEKFGTYNGVMMLVLMAAPALSPTIAGAVLSALGLHWMFYILIPVLTVVIIAMAVLLREVLTPKPATVDPISVLLSILGFGGVVFAVANAASAGFLALSTILPAAVGVAALYVYARIQLRSERPILNLRILTNPTYRYAISVVGVLQALLFGTILVGPLFLQEIWGMSAFEAGLLILPSGVVTAFANLLAGLAFDRWGSRIVAPGLVIVIAGFATVAATMLFDLGAPLFAIATAVYAAGLPFAMTSLNSMGLSSLEPAQFPDGSSLNNTIQQVTGSIGTALFAILAYSSPQISGAISDAPLASGSVLAFAVATVVAVVVLGFDRTIGRQIERRRLAQR